MGETPSLTTAVSPTHQPFPHLTTKQQIISPTPPPSQTPQSAPTPAPTLPATRGAEFLLRPDGTLTHPCHFTLLQK